MVQIRGIVKAAQVARNRLQAGIAPSDVADFKKFITNSIETIEQLCAHGRMTPSQLPTRSRQAYYFLKAIDLDNLPLAETQPTQDKVQTIRLKNIKTQQGAILHKIANLASTPTPNTAQIEELVKTLIQAVAAIEKICAASQATPANLTRSSRQIYAWMKFLTYEGNLQLHLQTIYRVKQIAEKVCNIAVVRQLRTLANLTEPLVTPIPSGLCPNQHGSGYIYAQPLNIVVELTHLTGIYKCKRSLVEATFTLSEGFINANDDTLEALVKAALFGKCQQTTRLIRDYAASEEYSSVLIELDLITEVIVENARGKCYNLDELFDKVNREYFASSLVKPRLIWSQINTYRKLGHYEPARDRVMIALTLDDARIPEFVVEFVLYHELLHKSHGATWVNGRRMVHTPEFRRDERKFKLYKEAEESLKKLTSYLI
ncbi:M48 family peptidase [Scytonema sp. PRP1]|uniref:M48 family peptidase n=1 Tax=Scytonema sp. PRP1 TaxID=3120513 RepID=UPI002FD3930B